MAKKGFNVLLIPNSLQKNIIMLITLLYSNQMSTFFQFHTTYCIKMSTVIQTVIVKCFKLNKTKTIKHMYGILFRFFVMIYV